MNDEDRLRELLRRADAALADGPRPDLRAAIHQARHDRNIAIAAGVAAVAAVIAVGWAVAGPMLDRGVPLPRPPVGPVTPTPTPAPTPTASPTGAGPASSCSASELGSAPTEQDLPPAVAEMRARITDAAVRCDYRELARLARPTDFTYSYGDQGDAARYWKKLEEPESSEEPMRMLVSTLQLPHCIEQATSAGRTVYAWPSVQCSNSTDEDFDALAGSGLYTEREIRQFRRGGGFYGWRIGITEEGDWLYFVAGD